MRCCDGCRRDLPEKAIARKKEHLLSDDFERVELGLLMQALVGGTFT